MTRLDLPGCTALGRPFKPVALGLCIFMITLTQANIRGIGALNDSTLANIVAVLTGAAFLALVGGWWGRSQRMAEIGLLLVGFSYTIRGFFIAFTNIGDIGVGLSIGALVVAFGSFFLEVRDPRDRRPEA